MDSVPLREPPNQHGLEGTLASARAAAEVGNVAAALSIYSAIQTDSPANADAFAEASACLNRARRFQEADQLLGPVLARFSNVARIWIEYGLTASHQREWTAAVQRWHDVRDRFPEKVEGYYFRSMALREAGDVLAAEELALAGVERFPRDFRLWHERGLAAHARRDWREAVRRYAEMREKFPDRPEGYSAAASSLGQAGHHSEAAHLLNAAVERFPNDARIAIEQAWNAIHLKDWAQAEGRCALLRKRFPESPDGYAIGALALLRNGELSDSEKIEVARFAEAELLAQIAAERFPNDWLGWMQLAWAAHISLNWQQAAVRWQNVRERFPALIEPYLFGAVACIKTGRDEAADQILESAINRFPNSTQLAIEHARLAEHRSDWPQALARWETFMTVFPSQPEGYIGIGSALIGMARARDADVILSPALRMFPDVLSLHIIYARIGSLVADGDEAQRRWARVRERFPAETVGWSAAAVDLFSRGSFAEADKLLASAVERFASNFEIHCEYARSAECREDWAEAVARWSNLVRLFPTAPEVHIGLAQAFFRGAHHFEVLLREGGVPEPLSEKVLIARADMCERSGKLMEAEKEWQYAFDHYPESLPIQRRYVSLLHTKGDLHLASELVEKYLAKSPTDFGLLRTRALLLADQRSWQAFFVQFEQMASIFASGPERRQMQADLIRVLPFARLDEAAASDGPDRSFEIPERLLRICADEAPRSELLLRLMMQFESLGSGVGAGCEFGLVQRRYGAEPLGLLRWADIRPQGLCEALSQQFAGVGDPNQTEVFVIESSNEYFFRDRRFQFSSHTFTLASHIDRDRFFVQQCRRLVFLRRKLLEDLKSGDKVFVYKCDVNRNSPLDIYDEVRRHNCNNKVLLVCEQDGDHRAGAIQKLAGGLYIGAVRSFSTTNIDFESWLRVCEDVIAVQSNAKTGSPMSPDG